MHIDTHLGGNMEEFEREDTSIGNHDEIVTIIVPKLIEEFCIISDLRRLQYWDILRDGELFHRTLSHHLITAKWLVGIGHNEYDINIRSSGQICEDRSGERWSTKKSNTHRKRL